MAQLMKLPAKLGGDIPDKSSPAILVTRKEFAKTMTNLLNFFLGVQQRDFGRGNITK